MAEIVVAGKRVEIRDTYPVKEYPDLISQYRGMKPENPISVVPVAQQMVVSWEYEGDPSQSETYQEMDAIALWGLFRGINDFWAERLYEAPKSLPAASTEP